MTGKVRLYLAGGMAANVGFPLYKAPTPAGYADVNACFIDTSLSNIRDKVGKDIKDEDIFILDDVDGSGKLRSSNAGKIQENIKSIIHKYPPEDVNIVLFSLSGGSGSTTGTLIMKELLEKEQTVVAVVVGSEESKITIENTVKSLQSLDHVSRMVHKPVVVAWYHNCNATPRTANDQAITQLINALTILCSKANNELDTADVANFINHQKVTSVQEGISFLYVTADREQAEKVEYPISSASLYTDPGVTPAAITPEYSCVGFTPKEVIQSNELHFIITQSDVKPTFDKLNKRLAEFTESSSARVTSSSLGGEANESGLVF